jgi:hypothetical protein
VPRFYFDVIDGENAYLDDEGVEVESLQIARDVAISTLPRLISEEFSPSGQHTLTFSIRDERGKVVFTVTVSGAADEDGPFKRHAN